MNIPEYRAGKKLFLLCIVSIEFTKKVDLIENCKGFVLLNSASVYVHIKHSLRSFLNIL